MISRKWVRRTRVVVDPFPFRERDMGYPGIGYLERGEVLWV